MAFNPSGASGVPLTVLAGLVTEMAPTALPEGVSPDNQEMMYLPGSAYSRAGFRKVFATPFPSTPTMVYGKSFVASNGTIYNLFLDSTGVMWVENLTTTPGAYTQLFTTTPGSYSKSITAFGREYFAISDGLHGTDIAYQWDGQFLDRVTQDGPGAPPVITSLALPSSTLAVTGGGVAQTISSISSTDHIVHSGFNYYSTFTVTLIGGSTIPAPGSQVVIAGNSNGAFNSTWTVLYGSGLSFVVSDYQATFQTGTGGTATASGAITLQRQNNLVTGATATAHQLLVGYQVQIQNVPVTAIGGGISSIVIANEDLPGEATVTTASAHGLAPGVAVTITGVLPVAVGGAIVSAVRNGGVVTLTMTSAHGLVPGAVIQVSGVTDPTFNASFTVQLVPSPTTLVYDQVDTDSSSSAGAVKITWPIPDNTPEPTYFDVLSAPTPTTFTIQVTYQDGTWTTGVVSFPWNGIFYVTAVPSPITFQYQQYGPPATTTAVGTATPYGQASPGLHLCQVLFLRRDGTITEPSPPTTFIANGGQYLSVSNLPIGPPNIVARILAFTGAQPNVPGILPPFFYLAGPAQLEGQVVSTGTQINDNTTTSAVLDFSDNSLFGTAASGGALSVIGNNPQAQIVIDGALGFAYFDSRLTTWGQRNRIQNLLNLSFDGGYVSGSPNIPLGWTTLDAQGSLISPFHTVGTGWRMTIGTPNIPQGRIRQTAYLDAYGAPILDGNITYKVRLLAQASTVDANLDLYIGMQGNGGAFNPFLLFSGLSTTPTWIEQTFNIPTPSAIPADTIIYVYAQSPTPGEYITISDLSWIDAQQPYLDVDAFTSYIDNPCAFDGVTGNGQPTEDTHKIMDFTLIRGTPYCVTQDPSGRLHEIGINPTSEPSGWNWREIASNCGTLSAFGLTHSQADDQSASGGEDWTAWPSEGGALIFDGSEPKKISQEIQPNWNAPYSSAPWVPAGSQINMAAATTIQVLNDPVERMLYFFLPIGSATAPSVIYPLSYRELNGAYAIANSPPIHVGLSGRLIVSDNTRKWTFWRRAMNGAARMYRSPGVLSTVFFGGNGQTPGMAPGFGNVYTLDPTLLTDDDYGQISPYYVTAFWLDPEKAQSLQLGFVRLLCAYANIFIAGVGTVKYTVLCDSITNPWAITTTRNLTLTPKFDQEFGGNQAQGNRMALKIQSFPIEGTSNSFNVQRVQLWFKKAKLQIRGAAS